MESLLTALYSAALQLLVLGCVLAIFWCAYYLIRCDFTSHVLPNKATLLMFLATTVTGINMSGFTVLYGGILAGGCYLVTGFLVGGVGGGDIKLAPSIGILSATTQITDVFLVVVGAQVLTLSVYALTFLRSRKSHPPAVAHGPMMLGSCGALLLLRYIQ